MLTVIYNPDSGVAVPDGKVADTVTRWIEQFSKGEITMIEAGTETLINEIRLAVLNDQIPFGEIQFQYQNEIIPHDEYGKLRTWPKGFCCLITRQVGELIRGASKKRQGGGA